MKNLWSVMLVCALAVVSIDADAHAAWAAASRSASSRAT